ncbi:hypothetical protein KFE25_012197 [Diacronema lutheri]|uniref:Uncharacterized protein n=1 Tax=Diacronema lutheri TaxID=2081491 RepID=A0A8J5XJB3_DIALT|nr:hypothetical protein KFE25_012197 [Diacronema lutheri]
MCTPSTASGTAIVACVMLLITIGIIAATVRWLMRGPAAAKPADCHPIELLEHAPNNYELASSISFILPLVGWLNRLEDSPRWAWLLGAKDNAQWWTPDAPLGWIFRVLNKVDWWLYRVFGVRIVYMDRAGFLAKCAVLDKPAYKQCASDNSAEGFRLMLDACEADHISATGRMMLNQLMNGWLDTRVAVDNYCRAHPEVTATPIKRPVIIIGCPRTASTFMHKLLAQDPKLRKPLFWELAIPSPPPDPATYATDARRSLVATGFRSFDAISPHFYTDVHKYHYFGVDEIEEDSVLVHYAGVLAMHGIAFAGDSAYARWQRDPRTKEAAYLVHKKVLQILSCKWEQPVQWLLKAPTIHSCFLEQLLKVYPDACLVVTHRQPVEVLPSWCKFVLSPMCATLWRHGTKHRLAEAKAREQLELFERIEETIARVRQTHGAQMFDVEYASLMANPMAVVERCYAHFQMPLSPEARGAMATFIAGSGSGHQNKKFGKVSTQEHADFLGVVGLSADDVTERLRIAALPPAQAAAARAAAPANAHASPVAR